MIHQAIYNTHPNVRAIRDNEDGTVVCLDQDENVVTLDGSEVEESTRLQSEYDNNQYQRDRATEYPAIADQLDDIFHNGIDGWKATIQLTKDKYPKEGN
jgi:hypothetical protein